MRIKRFSVIMIILLAVMLSAAASAEEITADALRKAIDSNLYINLFDVRSEDEYEDGAIPGASSIPLEELESIIQGILDQGYSEMAADIYLYGANAEDSVKAAEILTGLGFTRVHYLPGIGTWTETLVRPDLLLGDLKTVDIYGNAVDSQLISDKTLIMVNVWATYCNPCISEMEGLGEIYREMKDQGILIVGLLSDCTNADLSPNEATTETARLIAETTKADYPHILPSRTIYRNVLTQIQAVPTTFFVDGSGKMVGRVYVGSQDKNAWRKIIQTTLTQLMSGMY